MSLLVLTDVYKSFRGEDVLQGISFRIEAGERASLVGANGAGKTTLLALIARAAEADAGRIQWERGASFAWLEQDPTFERGRSARAEARAAFAELDRLEARLRAMEEDMRQQPDDEQLLAEYGDALHRFEERGGYERDARTDRVLAGLGFGPEERETPVEALSGGQRIRLGLVRLLLRSPDLLLLDEPTNHLDIEAIEWLEGYLANVYRGAVLMVSHDRLFLDRTTTRTFALHGGRLEAYPGNYTFYVRAREERLQRQEEEWRRVTEERKRLEAWVSRFKAGTRARSAKSKEKMIARLPNVEQPKRSTARMALAFDPAGDSGREVLKLRDLGHRYDGAPLFRHFSADVRRGQRIGLIGPNGAGKTTMLRILIGELQPAYGELLWGAGTEIGYFSQDLTGLNDSGTVLNEIMDADDFTLEEARSLLARFLFRQEDVQRPVSVLSGGERNRLLLAKLVISRANVLVLDEPTNHLDIPAREVLEEALAAFPGTIFFVTHDRYFLRLATRLWVFEDGAVRNFKGDWAAWEATRVAKAETVQGAGAARGTGAARGAGAAVPAKPQSQAAATSGPASAASGAPASTARTPASTARAPAPSDASAATDASAAADASADHRPIAGELSKNERQRLALELAELESGIEALEAERDELSQRLADPGTFQARDGGRAIVNRFEEVQEALEQGYSRWEEISGLVAHLPARGDARG